MPRTLVVPMLVLLLGGCSTERLVVSMMEPTFIKMKVAFEAEKSPQQAKHAGPGMLAMLEGFLVSDPENETLLGLAVELFTSYAYAFAEEEDTQWAQSLYEKALTYGSRLLDEEIEFSKTRKAGDIEAFKAELAKLDKEQLPTLFFTGEAYGGLINTSLDDFGMIEQLEFVLAMMQRVIELDETFYHGGAYLVLGTCWGSRGKDIGGKPELAAKYFEKGIEIGKGRFLLSRVAYARYYLVTTQQREAFLKTLKEIVEDEGPDQKSLILANAIARRRARRLIDDVDKHFLPSQKSKAEDAELKKKMGDLDDLD